MPSVTPMSVRNASSSCVTTYRGVPLADTTSWTMAAESAARRIGSVPRNVMFVAPSRRADSRVADERCRQLCATGTTEVAALTDRVAETQEDRLVGDHLESVRRDSRDEQVDRVRAEVDRGADGRSLVRRHRSDGSAARSGRRVVG